MDGMSGGTSTSFCFCSASLLSCVQPYSATDHTKYGKAAAGKKCPAEGYCMNCMPIKVCVWLCCCCVLLLCCVVLCA